MARRRRTPEQAREEILDAAQALLSEEGPEAIRITRVAHRAGMSHPGLLHHFGSAEQLVESLHQRVGRQIREDLVSLLSLEGNQRQAIATAAERLAEPSKGRLLAWVLANGQDPFPPASETGLAQIASLLPGFEEDPEGVRFRVLLFVLAMLGDSLMGAQVRVRLGLTEDSATPFRHWLLQQLSAQAPGQAPLSPAESTQPGLEPATPTTTSTAEDPSA